MANFWNISKWKPVTCLVTGRVWSPEKFEAEIGSRVGELKTQGIGRNDVVFICHYNSLEFLADLFALWTLGVQAAALSPSLTHSEMENLAAFANPVAILIGGNKELWEEKFKTPVLSLEGATGTGEKLTLGKKDFGLILFTSGTTGKPKGVVHNKGSIEKKISQNIKHFGKGVFGRSLCILSTHFVAGLLSNILTPLVAGGRVFLYPDPGVSGSARLGHLIDENRISMVNTVPSIWNIILKASPRPKKGSLELISVVSAPLREDNRSKIIAWAGLDKVYSLYGTTETGGWNTSFSEGKQKERSVGKVLGGYAAVINDKLKLEPFGTGELVLKTEACMAGYLKRPDLDAEVLQDGWFKTGDLARIDKEGFIEIIGREKIQINRAGIKINPEEIETLLENNPAVKKACVFSYPDAVMGEGVAALIEPVSGEKINFSTLRKWCKSRIRTVSIPEKWFETHEIPLNERGKFDRTSIQNRFNKKGKI